MNQAKDNYAGKFLFPFNQAWRTPMPDYDALAKKEIRSKWEPASGDTMRADEKEALKLELPIEYDTSRFYPTDPSSGLPYPILITDLMDGKGDTRVDYHHQFHPRAELETNVNEADIALRVCRGEDLPRWLHNRYHHQYDGLRLPETRQDKFAVVVLACAGLVPRQAMCLQADRSFLITPSREQYRQIVSQTHHEYKNKEGKATKYSTRRKIGTFFAHYALEQNIRDIVTDTIINQFLSPRSKTERITSGNQILWAALYAATEPIKPMYLEAFKETGITNVSPPKLRTVMRNFFSPGKREDYFPELEKRLAA